MSHAYEIAMVSTWTPTQEVPDNAHWRVLPPLRSIRLPDEDRTVWLADKTDGTFECFNEENEAPKQLVSMWGAPSTAGFVLVSPGSTDKVILNIHVELKRRSLDMAVQSTQDIVLVGRNGVIDPRSIVWEGRFYSSSMVYLQHRPRWRLRETLDLRAFFMNDVHIDIE